MNRKVLTAVLFLILCVAWFVMVGCTHDQVETFVRGSRDATTQPIVQDLAMATPWGTQIVAATSLILNGILGYMVSRKKKDEGGR